MSSVSRDLCSGICTIFWGYWLKKRLPLSFLRANLHFFNKNDYLCAQFRINSYSIYEKTCYFTICCHDNGSYLGTGFH